MASIPRRTFRSAVFTGLLSLLYLTTSVDALGQKYCSSQNTGSGSDPENWGFQSNGHCSEVCGSNYAFAIVQGLNCWCSNYVPYEQKDVSLCSQTCPGYPYEFCGNTDTGLYGYVPLGRNPSGTLGAPSSTSRSSPSSSPTTRSNSTSQTTAATTTTRAVTTPTTPVTTTIVNSVGSIITVTSTPTLPASTDKIHPTNKGINGGVVAGIVIAVVIGLLVVIGGFFFIWFRRYRRNRDDLDQADNRLPPQRMNSQMSKNGLLGTQAVPTFAFRRTTPPQTLGDSPVGSTSPHTERRNSRPLHYDQRLNPQALMIHEDLSRNSINTIDDGRDYGRRLNVTNPDPADRD